MDPRYSAICGYTEADLDEVFAPELAGLDRDEIRRWYNGYRWRGTEGVYNPFDLLLLFKRREFEPHWFETGTPTFLPELLLRRRVGPPELELMAADKDLLSKFDVGDIGTEALLFQTGYLTIKGERREGWQTRYTLGYPNMEVRLALNKKLLQTMLPAAALRVADAARLGALLTAGDLKGLERQLRKLFQSIPTDWHRKNKITEYEGYYAAVVLAWFHTQQLRAVAEDSGSGGRADLTLLHERGTYVFEFKVAGRGAAETALKQIKAKGYADKYLDAGRPVYLVGVEFSPETRNVERFDTERVQ